MYVYSIWYSLDYKRLKEVLCGSSCQMSNIPSIGNQRNCNGGCCIINFHRTAGKLSENAEAYEFGVPVQGVEPGGVHQRKANSPSSRERPPVREQAPQESPHHLHFDQEFASKQCQSGDRSRRLFPDQVGAHGYQRARLDLLQEARHQVAHREGEGHRGVQEGFHLSSERNRGGRFRLQRESVSYAIRQLNERLR